MKYVYWALGIGALIALLTYAVVQKPVQEISSESSTVSQSDSAINDGAKSTDVSESASLKPGVYKDYSEGSIGDAGYNRTIIFFHAPWCPECRSFEQIIRDSDIPEGVQILKTDYDSSIDLRKKYGVTIQTSFVGVDMSGDKLKLWSGYGQAKSLDAILDNTK